MSRTAYHRAYYWSRIGERRASARASRRKARERAAVIKIVCNAVDEARNEKPPVGGGLTRQGGCLTLNLRFQRDGSLTDCSSPVNHPTTPKHSGMLVGETTRSITLNLHRGGQPVGALRKRRGANGSQGDEPWPSTRPQRMAPSVINSARSRVRRTLSLTPCGFTISH